MTHLSGGPNFVGYNQAESFEIFSRENDSFDAGANVHLKAPLFAQADLALFWEVGEGKWVCVCGVVRLFFFFLFLLRERRCTSAAVESKKIMSRRRE